jgi:hypothetical protein
MAGPCPIAVDADKAVRRLVHGCAADDRYPHPRFCALLLGVSHTCCRR